MIIINNNNNNNNDNNNDTGNNNNTGIINGNFPGAWIPETNGATKDAVGMERGAGGCEPRPGGHRPRIAGGPARGGTDVTAGTWPSLQACMVAPVLVFSLTCTCEARIGVVA